ncbi:hypothetical protein [Mucilaginibacter corticis]|uniref:hypothetical protein n=1 Tax=Mucilaginibacter corticis TaxID=2597670 RepID=UPI0016426110|nr:hypothetical protein [Mucilaginibacter corticis]
MKRLIVIVLSFNAIIARAQSPAQLFGGSVINNGDMTFNASFTPDRNSVLYKSQR